MLNKALLELKKNGFVVYKNAISKKEIAYFFNFFKKVLSTYADCNYVLTYNSFEDLRLHNFLINLKKKKPKVFSAVYDAIILSSALRNFFVNSGIEKIASRLLRVNNYEICPRSQVLRMDPPADNSHSYGWHQDSAYTNYNQNGLNALIVWIPLLKVNNLNGTLKICKNSHREGTIKAKKYFGKGIISEQILVPDRFVKKYKILDMDVNQGDAVITYSNLIHKSGDNRSQLMRLTALIRYHKILSKDFFKFPK